MIGRGVVMPKINQEEYEKIKLLPDYDWNWIAREKTGKILSFTNKPTKTDEVWKDKQTRLWFNYKDSQLFQFIQWEDEEPYEIAELIREYEIKELRIAPSGTVIVDSFDESEEVEVKRDSEWMKEEFRKLERAGVIDSWVYRDLWMMANQLDEPEVLSLEWIEEHRKSYTMEDSIEISDLQNLLVPKQELPVIPKYVAEYLDFAKKEASLIEVLVIVSVGWPTMKKEFSWILANSEIFARAWLDGYEVEEEPLYCVEDGKHTLLCKWESSDGWKVISTVEATEDGLHTDTLVFELTEQEIKDYDARFWPFAKKVEELEE